MCNTGSEHCVQSGRITASVYSDLQIKSNLTLQIETNPTQTHTHTHSEPCGNIKASDLIHRVQIETLRIRVVITVMVNTHTHTPTHSICL